MPVLRRLSPAAAAMLPWVALSLVALLVVAGCSVEPPRVTFAAAGASVAARPAQYCDLALTDCVGDATAPVELAVPAGTALQVSVPDVIAQTPWQVVFSYRDGAGAQTDQRSPVFAPAERSNWTLEMAAPTDHLLTAQVQQYGPPPRINPDTGEIEFPIRASWVLNTSG